eukprot:COSAG01_NODE_42019_length_444_cov_1.582609_2_plen_31_part_01
MIYFRFLICGLLVYIGSQADQVSGQVELFST